MTLVQPLELPETPPQTRVKTHKLTLAVAPNWLHCVEECTLCAADSCQLTCWSLSAGPPSLCHQERRCPSSPQHALARSPHAQTATYCCEQAKYCPVRESTRGRRILKTGWMSRVVAATASSVRTTSPLSSKSQSAHSATPAAITPPPPVCPIISFLILGQGLQRDSLPQAPHFSSPSASH